MSREHLCVLVYLVTVMHSMQAGFMEKAERYTDKAIVQVLYCTRLKCNVQ